LSFLALDLSKTSAGWAQFKDGWDRPIYGSFRLGSEYTTIGGTCAALHRELAAIHKLTPVEWGFIEKPLTAAQLQGNTNADSLFILAAIAAHAHSFAYAKSWAGQRVIEVNIATWRKHFFGSQPRGTKSKTLKQLAWDRCVQLGWRPKNDDEADALGILDYALHTRSITPPWAQNEVLRAPLGAR
jgi:hypothetical protein